MGGDHRPRRRPPGLARRARRRRSRGCSMPSAASTPRCRRRSMSSSDPAFERSVIEAAARAGLVVQVSPDLIFSPAVVDRASTIVRAAPDGITVSAFREALGHEPEVRAAPARALRPHRRHAPRRRPAVPLARRRCSGSATSAVTATSTLAPSGSEAIPTAARACRPASPERRRPTGRWRRWPPSDAR